MLKDTDIHLKQELDLEEILCPQVQAVLSEEKPAIVHPRPPLLILPSLDSRISLCVRDLGRFWLPWFPKKERLLRSEQMGFVILFLLGSFLRAWVGSNLLL